jgi:pilus assembly protein CpaD
MIRPWLIVLLGAGLSGCVVPVPPPTATPQQIHPITVEREVVSLPITLRPGRETLPVGDVERLDLFVARFRDEARGPLNITLGRRGAQGGDPYVAADRIVAHLRRGGVRPGDIRVGLQEGGRAGQGVAVVSYQRFRARPPSCGKWWTDLSFNPTNTKQPNFGCATQRYLGLLVADPGEFLSQRRRAASDTERRSLVIRNYRLGEPTGSSIVTGEETISKETTK